MQGSEIRDRLIKRAFMSERTWNSLAEIPWPLPRFRRMMLFGAQWLLILKFEYADMDKNQRLCSLTQTVLWPRVVVYTSSCSTSSLFVSRVSESSGLQAGLRK